MPLLISVLILMVEKVVVVCQLVVVVVRACWGSCLRRSWRMCCCHVCRLVCSCPMSVRA